MKGSINSSAASGALLYSDSLKIHAESVTSDLRLRMHNHPPHPHPGPPGAASRESSSGDQATARSACKMATGLKDANDIAGNEDEGRGRGRPRCRKLKTHKSLSSVVLARANTVFL